MRALILTMALPFLGACVNLPVSAPAVCLGTIEERPAHARALIADGGPLSQATGADLLSKLEAGCGE
jgi:hypothetical protein